MQNGSREPFLKRTYIFIPQAYELKFQSRTSIPKRKMYWRNFKDIETERCEIDRVSFLNYTVVIFNSRKHGQRWTEMCHSGTMLIGTDGGSILCLTHLIKTWLGYKAGKWYQEMFLLPVFFFFWWISRKFWQTRAINHIFRSISIPSGWFISEFAEPRKFTIDSLLNTVPTQFCFISQFCFTVFEPGKWNTIETSGFFQFSESKIIKYS